jgi:NADH-quinone oxidoreductase subunit G
MAVRDLRPGPNGEPPEVFTKTPMVKKAREGVMEFLLINHPLDCPICDQGGECDLQDQAMAYGVDSTRFKENKRAVEDKYIGPLVKTQMTRCIQCTRCVRFTAEVAGIGDLGLISRGEDVEITTYLETAMQSELQGNVVDLCPVGALTSKPYEFAARPWELSKTESIDVMDALGSNIRVDTRGREVMRILPRINEAVNEEWISDKTRHIVDGLKTQRLDRPYLRVGGRLQPATWAQAFSAIATKLKATSAERIGVIAGDLASVEELYALKLLSDSLGIANIDARVDGTKLHPKYGRASYLFNVTVEGIDNADALLLIGTNPRKEAPVLNARIHKRWLRSKLPIAVIGERVDLTHDYDYLGAGVQSLTSLIAGDSPFLDVLKAAKQPLIVVGQGALTRADGAALLGLAAKLVGLLPETEGQTSLSIMHTAASRVGALDVGFVPAEGGLDMAGMLAPGAVDVLINLGADEVSVPAGAFVVYIGTHGDRGAERADVILPGAAYTEKSGTYVNLEGRVQIANRAAFPPGDAREDWAILRALSDVLGKRLPFGSLAELRKGLYAVHPHLLAIGTITPPDVSVIKGLVELAGDVEASALKSTITDFYLTNPIARASKTMATCAGLVDTRLLHAAE